MFAKAGKDEHSTKRLMIAVRSGAAADGGTVLTLVHERLDALAAAMPQVAGNVGPGWESALGKLPAAIPGG